MAPNALLLKLLKESSGVLEEAEEGGCVSFVWLRDFLAGTLITCCEGITILACVAVGCTTVGAIGDCATDETPELAVKWPALMMGFPGTGKLPALVESELECFLLLNLMGDFVL